MHLYVVRAVIISISRCNPFAPRANTARRSDTKPSATLLLQARDVEGIDRKERHLQLQSKALRIMSIQNLIHICFYCACASLNLPKIFLGYYNVCILVRFARRKMWVLDDLVSGVF